MDKKELRKQIKESLTQNKSTLPGLSKTICEHILNSEQYIKADSILAYMALPDEVDLFPVIQDALHTSKKIYLPKVDPASPHMEFYQYTKAEQTCTGAFGIQEPDITVPFKLCSKNTLVLVPGRGFTSDGCRLGRGKAYYDTYFGDLKGKVVLAGVCFGLQLLPQLPVESHDVFMDFIVTEKGFFSTK